MKYIDDGGVEQNIRGPRRHDERRAQADLEAIRAAGANKPTRAEYLEAMQKKACGSIICYASPLLIEVERNT